MISRFSFALFLCIAFLHIMAVARFSCALPRFLRGRPRGRDGMLGAPAVGKHSSLPADQWFTQRLSHFDDSNTATWQQRYFVNDSFWRKDEGPVFLMIGGEGTANPAWMVQGTWIKYAQELGALCLMLEHRFYGKSHPTSDLSDASLRYLNSEQALADLAAFRQAMMKKFKLRNTTKWVSFGGSYPGCLSAWFRLKYPHLVHGAVATSGPVFAQLNFPEYLEVVTASLDTTGPQCTQNIALATQKIDSLLTTSAGIEQLNKLFRLCKPLDMDNLPDFNEIATFTSNLAGNFEGVVQYNKDNRAFEGAIGTNITIDTLCGIMNDESVGDPLARYAKVNSLMLDTHGETCLDSSYKDLINELRQTSWSSSASEGGRQWMYQTCTEFGFYQSSDSAKQPFGNHFPLKYSIQQCMDIFGEQFNSTNIQKGIDQTNTNYGGRGIASSRIVFPNGSIDPWHAMGILSDVTPSETAVYIKGTAHCANMYPETPQDPPQLIQARQHIRNVIVNWLKEQ